MTSSATPGTATLLYKLLRKPTANVEYKNSALDEFEGEYPDLKKSSVDLVSQDTIGLEIEIERVREQVPVSNYPVWYTHTDGSLRNGIEYVTKPIAGQRVAFALNWLFACLKSYNFSPRTSIHVHLNVLDMTKNQIAMLVAVYLCFERLFYKFVGGDRDKSNFCVPILETSSPVLDWLSDEEQGIPNWQDSRYMGLNLCAMGKFGTLEFRHLGGTDHKEKILKWINLILCLKRFAKANSSASIVGKIQLLNTNSAYGAFFNEVFPGSVGECLDRRNLKEDMEDAVSQVKEMSLTKTWRDTLRATFKTTHYWFTVLVDPNKGKKKESEYVWKPDRPIRPARPAGTRVEVQAANYVPDDEAYIQGLIREQRVEVRADMGILADEEAQEAQQFFVNPYRRG